MPVYILGSQNFMRA